MYVDGLLSRKVARNVSKLSVGEIVLRVNKRDRFNNSSSWQYHNSLEDCFELSEGETVSLSLAQHNYNSRVLGAVSQK